MTSLVFTGGDADRAVNIGGLALTTEPVTLMVWFKKAADTAGDSTLCCVANDLTVHLNLVSIGQGSGGPPHASARDGTEGSDSAGAANSAVDSWQCHIGIFASHTSRRHFLDGAGDTEDTEERVTDTFNDISLGNGGSPAVLNRSPDGKLSHLAIWDIALDSTAIAALVAGADPRVIEPSNLKHYYPGTLDGGLYEDVVGGADLTITGATTDADAPPVDSATVTGTATAAITEVDIAAGGKTIILTLENATWVT